MVQELRCFILSPNLLHISVIPFFQAKPLLGGKKYAQLVDTKISSSYKEDQLKWLVQVTEQCLRKNPKERSSMNVVVSALQGIEDTDDLCAVEDSSAEKSSIQLSVPDMTCSQGLRNAYKQNPDEEQISNIHMMYHMKDDQISQDQNCTEGSLQIEKRGTRLTTLSNQIARENNDEEQTQCSFCGDSLDNCKVKVTLKDSKSSVCSVCKSKRPHFGWQKDFSYDELHMATDGFSIKNSLTEGVYGPSFRGQLKCNLKIVIKQLQMTSSQEEKIFKSEVQFLFNARHENVVMLLGSCIDKTRLLIVYDYACNGSLDQHLSGQSCRSLTWRERVKIAIGLSRGLKYLHEKNTIHGSIKPSNILLTHDFEALVGDFGFGKSKNELKNWSKKKMVENTGYEAPELLESGKFSTKADVYSLGVVLLELITGHRVMDKVSGKKSLIDWAKPLLRGRTYPQLVDPKIGSSYDDQELFSLVQVMP
ncbi:proline-rich receptor-like protein kinase PERK8, partial [Neltuma alba]|uniref:proline-rich receptor-like protein kinase PERK8 n=1 Tax=Neltuma alba TaxID=207710 RepID=UPI0010A5137F